MPSQAARATPSWTHYAQQDNRPQADYGNGVTVREDSLVVEDTQEYNPFCLYGQGHSLDETVYDDWGLPVTTPESHYEGRTRCRPWIMVLNLVALAALAMIVLTGGPVSDYDLESFSSTSSNDTNNRDGGNDFKTTWTLLGDELLGGTLGRSNRVVGFGHNVAISEDGNRIAVARTSGRRDAPGQVYVYSWSAENGGQWEKEQVLFSKIPTDVVEVSDEKQHTPLAMAPNGKRVAYTQGNRVVVFECYEKSSSTEDQSRTAWREVGAAMQSDSALQVSHGKDNDDSDKNNDGSDDFNVASEEIEETGDDYDNDDNVPGRNLIGDHKASFGSHLAFSHDGLELAVVGYDTHDKRSFVRIFRETVDGHTGRRQLVSSPDIVLGESPQQVDALAFSSDGTKIAIGSSNRDGAKDNQSDKTRDLGRVQVFHKNGNTHKWSQIGQTIAGDKNSRGSFGGTVSLSEDGTYVAAGVKYGGGSVRVYRFAKIKDDSGDEKSHDWQLHGQVLEGADFKEHFGAQVQLSRDGSQLVVGIPCDPELILGELYLGESLNQETEPYVHGKVHLFEYDSDASEWSKIGSATSQHRGDGFGRAVALSAGRVIVGAPLRVVDDKRNVGSVHVFETSDA